MKARFGHRPNPFLRTRHSPNKHVLDFSNLGDRQTGKNQNLCSGFISVAIVSSKLCDFLRLSQLAFRFLLQSSFKYNPKNVTRTNCMEHSWNDPQNAKLQPRELWNPHLFTLVLYFSTMRFIFSNQILFEFCICFAKVRFTTTKIRLIFSEMVCSSIVI